MGTPAPGSARRRWRGWLAGLLLAIAGFIAYSPTFRAEFIWDDNDYVWRNPVLKSTQGLDGLRAIWIPRLTPQYYPMVFTSFWIEEQLYPDDPEARGGKQVVGYHVVNLLLHIGSALLLAAVLQRVGVGWGVSWATAWLFALHPVHVETVAWVTERKNVLSMFFFLLAALAYLRFDRERESRRLSAQDHAPTLARGGGAAHTPWSWYGLALLLFVAALLSKSVTASLPVVLGIALWWRSERLTVRRLWPLAPMLALGAAAGLHTGYLERVHVGAIGADWDFTLLDRVVIASRAILFYPWKILWPHPLLFVYPRWVINSGSIMSYWAVGVGIVLLAVLLLLWRRAGVRGPLAASAAYGVMIFPALGFADIFPMRFSFVADHFQYHASIGTLVLAAGSFAWLVRNARLQMAALTLASLICAALTYRQATIYDNEETLYTHTIDRNPAAWMAQTNLASWYLGQAEQARLREDAAAVAEAARKAERHARAALEARPGHDVACSNLAEALRMQGRYDEAMTWLDRAIESAGTELADQQRRGNQLKIRLAAADVAEYNALRGRLFELMQQPDKAIEAYEQAIAVEDLLLVHEALSRLYATAGRLDRAAPHYEAILRKHPDDLPALLALGEYRRQSGQYREARDLLTAALDAARNPEEEMQAAWRLGWLCATARDDAARDGRYALLVGETMVRMTGGSSPHAFDLFAAALAEVGRFDEAVHAAEQARIIAEAHNLTDLLAAIQARMEEYRAGRPHRE